jgi:PPOX class probable F420-dependent enzyme
MPISPARRALLDLPMTFARLATILPDGSPQATVMAFRRVGDTLRMTCEPNAVKARNIRRDPRVAVIVEHPHNPGHYVQMRVRAEVIDDLEAGSAEVRAQAQRYLGAAADDYLATNPQPPTIVLVVYPEKFSEYRDDLLSTSSDVAMEER